MFWGNWACGNSRSLLPDPQENRVSDDIFIPMLDLETPTRTKEDAGREKEKIALLVPLRLLKEKG
jgi:hypothetical protein